MTEKDKNITWKKKGSYQVFGYNDLGQLIYTFTNKWALGWWHLDNVWEGYKVGQFAYPSLEACDRAEQDYNETKVLS